MSIFKFVFFARHWMITFLAWLRSTYPRLNLIVLFLFKFASFFLHDFTHFIDRNIVNITMIRLYLLLDLHLLSGSFSNGFGPHNWLGNECWTLLHSDFSTTVFGHYLLFNHLYLSLLFGFSIILVFNHELGSPARHLLWSSI